MGLTTDEKKYLKQVGLRIRTLREQRGWTLEDTEEHGWTSWRHLQRIESGKNVTVVTIKKVALLFKCKVSEILD